MIGKLLNSDPDSSSKEPEKSDDNLSTSKEPDSSSVNSLEEVTTPWTPSPVPWYDNSLCELQPDAQQMAGGKDDQSGKLGFMIVCV